jgi:hypothetical protein
VSFSNIESIFGVLGNGYGKERLGREPVVGIPIEPGSFPLGPNITRFHTFSLPFPSPLQKSGSPATVQYTTIE